MFWETLFARVTKYAMQLRGTIHSGSVLTSMFRGLIKALTSNSKEAVISLFSETQPLETWEVEAEFYSRRSYTKLGLVRYGLGMRGCFRKVLFETHNPLSIAVYSPRWLQSGN